ncbi:MAG: GNAT family N-acetyltransferase [Saprospiraceae bacterium]|nr:GNAT family N-acetyltransferase [Saprospiraceae bacterium]
MNDYSIEKYNDGFRTQILSVWEKSVLATHDFLSEYDFKAIKALVATINFNDFQVYCLTNQSLVLGFIGVAGEKIEMLFLDPQYFGQGLGQVLLRFGVNELGANKLDVNEQNLKALNFYQKFGFIPFDRTEKDEQGKDYPLLRMTCVPHPTVNGEYNT